MKCGKLTHNVLKSSHVKFEWKFSSKKNQFAHSSQEILIDIYCYDQYSPLSMAETNILVTPDQINHSNCGENSLVVRKIQLVYFSSKWNFNDDINNWVDSVSPVDALHVCPCIINAWHCIIICISILFLTHGTFTVQCVKY